MRTAILTLTMAIGLAAQPANWVHRVHPNGQWYDLYIPSAGGIVAGHTYPMVLALHGCCRENNDDPGMVVVGEDAIFRAWHGYGANVQPEPIWIVAPGSAVRWDTWLDNIMEILDSLRVEFPIDSQRIIITGFSMGGAGAYSYTNAHPNYFSASIPVAAAVDGTHMTAANVKNVPAWGGVGEADSWIVQHRMAVNLIRREHGDTRGGLNWVTGVNQRLSTFPGVGHGEAMGVMYGLTNPSPIDWARSRINDGNYYPNVRFSSHTNDQQLTYDSELFTVVPTDDDGEITTVEFFLDGNLAATATAAPWQGWVSGMTAGQHVITATATDNGTAQGFTIDKTATATITVSTQGQPSPVVPRTYSVRRAARSLRVSRHEVAVRVGNGEAFVLSAFTLQGKLVASASGTGPTSYALRDWGVTAGTCVLRLTVRGTIETAVATVGR